MKKTMLKFSVFALTALALTALPLTAAAQAEPPRREANPDRATTFRGFLAEKTADSIIVTNITVPPRTITVTAETRILKSGQAATLADGVVGEPVSGSYRERDGKLEARMIRFGRPAPRPETPAPQNAPGGTR